MVSALKEPPVGHSSEGAAVGVEGGMISLRK